MKDASAGVPPKFLLVVATLLAGTTAPPPRAAQPKAQSPRAAEPSKAFMRVTVRQGEVRREPFVLTSDCLPHFISLRSEADFFRFEQPTDSVLVGRDRPATLNALVDATRLKPKLYSFTVTVKCLNCGSVKCNHHVTRLPIEVEVVKPSESTTTAPAAELEELSRNGPAIPDTFPLDDLKFRALFRWGWSVRLVFELARPGDITLTVHPDGYDRPLVYEERGLSAGVHEKSFTLPDAAGVRRPDITGAATYSVKAVTEGATAEGVEPFFLRSMAAGGARAAATRGARLTRASYGGLHAAWGRAAVSLGIEEVTFSPRDVRVVGDRPTASAPYSFRVTLPFNGGAKALVRLVSGGASSAVSSQSLGRLEAGQTVRGDWDCLKEGAPSLGRHRLMVRAWYTVQSGGDYEFAHSADSVLVRR